MIHKNPTLQAWCRYVRRSPVKLIRPSEITSPQAGLRFPQTEEELHALIAQDAETHWSDGLTEDLDPDFHARQIVEMALDKLSHQGVQPELLRGYVLHRVGDGLEPESFHLPEFPPDTIFRATLRKMGWTDAEFLELSLKRLAEHVTALECEVETK